jgi:hypothetical protein
MSYSIYTRKKAESLRRQGKSVKFIAKTLHIAQSTSSLWLQNIHLSDKAIKELQKNKIVGQYKTKLIRQEKRKQLLDEIDTNSLNRLKAIPLNTPLYQLLASFLIWTEGGKSAKSYVNFINSDPIMIKTFLFLLRKGFTLNEKKFRALVHIHTYHNENQIRNYWINATQIPITQFSKCYLKPNTKHRIREGYKGCIRIRYYDYRIALQLRSFYNSFVRKIGP